VASDPSAGIVFWVVIRDKSTKKIVSTRKFRTHDEAVHYHVSADGEDNNGKDVEISIEILAPGKAPK
jgi:hypothetical protein